ncbi:hypothetical protein ACOMHN_065724 [Nucella lapillus]
MRAGMTLYQVIQDCPNVELSSDGIASRCEPQHHYSPHHQQGRAMEDLPLWLPVTSIATNLTYFNRYCFLCSGDLGPAFIWAVNVSCSDWVDLQSLASEKDVLRTAADSGLCDLELQPPPGVSTMPCSLGPLGVPPEKLSDSEEICLPLNCAPGKRLKGDTCQPVIGRSRGLQYSLTLLIELFVRSSDIIGGVTSESLSSLCSLEELIKAGVTQKTPHLHSEAYNLTGWIVSAHRHEKLTSFDAHYDKIDDIYFDDSASILEYQDDYVNNVTVTVKEFQLGQVLIWFDFFVTTDTNRNDVEQTAVRMTEEDWHVVCGNAVARLVPVRKHREDTTVLNDTTIQRDENMSPKEFRESVIHIDYNTMWDKGKSVPVTVTPLLICPFLTFASEEYFIGPSDMPDDNIPMVNLTLMNETQTVRVADIERDKDGNMNICGHLFQEKFSNLFQDEDKATTYKPDREEILFWVLVEHYLSLICVSVSLVCLLLTIVTYSLFRSLRSIPGQNTIALCCSLFLAQGLLQFGVNWPELKGGCIALGMLIHYFWLSSILWMNVSSFHMHRVFTARHTGRTSSTHVSCCVRRFVAYSVYAQGVPLVVIGVTVSSSIFVFQGRQIGYGGDLCYLSRPVLVGAAFAAPLGLVLILNLIFFLGAVRAITKTETPFRVGETVLQNGHRSPSPRIHAATPFPSPWRRNLNVCIRLSSLTGLFWALGLIAELLDLRVLRMVSVVMNGSQGVLIAASYLPTRRVRRLYAQLCCTCRRGRQQSGTASLSGAGSPSSGNLAATVTTSVRSASTARELGRNQNNSDV